MRGRGLVIIVAILVVAAAVAGYLFATYVPGPPARAAPARTEITIVDSSGKYVTIPWPLRRIVALSTPAVEAIIALGAEDVIVGVTSYVDRKPELLPKVADKPRVGTRFKPNIEAIVAANPEAVITFVKWPKPEVLDKKLEPFGVKVIRLDLYRVDTLFAEIRLLGLLLNRTREAEELVKFWSEILESVKKALAEVRPGERPRVYLELHKPLLAAGPGSGLDAILRCAGGVNVFADSPIPYPKVSSEAVIQRNPSVIIRTVICTVFQPYTAVNASKLEELIEEIASRPGWSSIEAVKAGKVYVISATLTGGPRVVLAVCYVAKWLFPERLKWLDPEDIHREYMERFLRVPYRGIWAYPPP